MGRTKVIVGPGDFDIRAETAAAASESDGATVCFVGTVRGEGVLALELEHYPGMTEKAIGGIVSSARGRWAVGNVTVIHRVGKLLPGENIVLALVTSPHRREAFEACEFIMDWLKTEAPFWKRETTESGAHWVEARSSDDEARDRWIAGTGDGSCRGGQES